MSLYSSLLFAITEHEVYPSQYSLLFLQQQSVEKKTNEQDVAAYIP